MRTALRVLVHLHLGSERIPPFPQTLTRNGLEPLAATGIEVLQVNVGKLCNQTCRHCHVDAGPDRREIMSRDTLAECLDVLSRTDIPVVDITGGAPELNPHFRWFVGEVRRLDRHVIDRCNLTILLTNGREDLPDFLAAHEVEVIASLPCYLEVPKGWKVKDKGKMAMDIVFDPVAIGGDYRTLDCLNAFSAYIAAAIARLEQF